MKETLPLGSVWQLPRRLSSGTGCLTDLAWLSVCALLELALKLAQVVSDLLRPYRIGDYVGDGTIEDRGFSGPGSRYRVHFPEFSLATLGKYRFSSRGLPPEHLSLSFDCEAPLLDDADSCVANPFEDAQTVLAVAVLDDDGEKVAECSGPLADWACSRPGECVVSHSQMRGFDADPQRSYEIRIAVQPQAGETLDVLLRPHLSGGWCLDLCF